MELQKNTIYRFRGSEYSFKFYADKEHCFIIAQKNRFPNILFLLKHNGDEKVNQEIFDGLNNKFEVNRDFGNYPSIDPQASKYCKYKWIFISKYKELFGGGIEVCYSDLTKTEEKLDNFYNACDVLKQFLGCKRLNEVAIFCEELKKNYVVTNPKLFRTYQRFHSGTEVRE